MFEYTSDEDMLPYNHLDPDEINDIDSEPIEFEKVVF